MVDAKVCPKCGGTIEKGSLDIDVFIKDIKVGTLENTITLSCRDCSFDALVLQVDITPAGIYIGKGEE